MRDKIKIRLGEKAALELAIGTIVIIVIAMSMLILGIVLVRQVMCAGIILTDQVTQSTESEIKSLFSSAEHGIKCMGEAGDEPRIGGGGRRQIVCIVDTEINQAYRMRLTGIEFTTDPAPIGFRGTDDAEKLVVLPTDVPGTLWEGVVSPGAQKTITVALLDIPRSIDSSGIHLTFEESRADTLQELRGAAVVETHDLFIDILPTSAFRGAIC